MPIWRQNEWTINSRSFYVMRTHYSSNKVDNFTFVDAKQSIKWEENKKPKSQVENFGTKKNK